MLRLWKLLARALPSGALIPARVELYDGRPLDKIPVKEKIGLLYQILTILDTKAASLMQFNGIIIAVLAIFLEKDGSLGLSTSSAVALVSSIASIFLCLSIVSVFWRFLEIAVPAKGAQDVDGEIAHLCQALWAREWCYQAAWIMSVVSIFAMAVFLLWR